MLLEALEIHNTLNPKLWSKDNELLPEVREKLIGIVNYFVEYIDVPVRVVDVHLVGSNCSYNYTEHSDLDVHIVANFETANVDKTFLMALYNEKRWSFNASHDIKIRGIDVELYVEDIKSTTISNGIYSLYSNKWIKFPEKIPVPKKVDVSHEVERWEEEIQKILNSENTEKIKRAIDLLYMMRKNSIDVDGEYGKGNQIFKEIRNKGLLDELKDAVKKSISKDLSLEQLGEGLLTEDKRSQLLNKSKSSVKGMQRFKRRVKSKVANTVRQFNSIDMNKLFRENILTVNISVNGETDNYIVKISYGGFLDYLKEEVSRNGGIVDLRAITRALLKGFNQDNVYIHCSCLHQGTIIPLLDGSFPTIEQLLERFNNGETVYVYSVDKNGDFKPGVVEKVWITGNATEFTKVTLDNGEEVVTTPDHMFMLRDGTYTQASSLKEGDSLMPMYMGESNGYQTVKFNSTGKYHSTYKEVANYFKKEEIEEADRRANDSDGMRYRVAIHHVDFNKNNNVPENLKPMTAREHWEYHSSLAFNNKPLEVQESIRKKSSENIKKRNENPTPKMIETRLKNLEKGRLRNYDEDRRIQQAEVMRKVISDYHKNMSDSDREELSKRLSKQLKESWENGCFNTEAFKKASEERGKFLCSKEIEALSADGVRNYWKNISDEERERRASISRENQKKAVASTRGKKFTEEHKENMRKSMLSKTPEEKALHVEKIAKSKIKWVLMDILKEGEKITEESYQNHRRNGDPPFTKVFKSLDDAVRYFEINHKVVKVETIYENEQPVYDIKVKDFHNFLVGAGVVVHNCPDFYYRFSYVCTKNNTNSGDPQNIPAPITNPHDSLGSSCKHTLLVLNNNSWVIKVASVINNYIAYMEKNYKNMYAEVMYPAIYGKKYEEPVQTSIFDDETELAGEDDTDVIDKANIDKVKSTQFQKGNQQGYKFVSDKDDVEQTSIFDDEV